MQKLKIFFQNKAIYGIGITSILMSLSGQVKADTWTAANKEADMLSQTAHKTDAWIPVPLAKVGLHLQADPKGIWSKDETEGDGGSGIWYGTYKSDRLGGTLMISQIVNGSCGSPSDCPVRVIFNNGASSKILLQSEQMCAVASDFRISVSLKSIKACDRIVPLGNLE